MFDVKAALREVEAEENPKNENAPAAKAAKVANKELRISRFSRFSTTLLPENENTGKLALLQLINCEPSQNDAPEESNELAPFTDHETAEHKINGLALRDDRAFVRRMLLRAYGADRLALVNQYFIEWRKGENAESAGIKKENAGRRRANTWLRRKIEDDKGYGQ